MVGSEGSSGRLSEVEYRALVTRVQSVVAQAVPPGASVLVVSKGDGALLDLPGSKAAHFPQAEDGQYAGHHPLDSEAAVEQLEEQRRRGAEFLVLPATSLWWLQHYDGFARHLTTHCTPVLQDPDSCFVYSLGQSSQENGLRLDSRPDQSVASMRDFLKHLMPDEAILVSLDTGGASLGELSPMTVWGFPASTIAEQGPERLLGELERLADAGAGYLVVLRDADPWLKEQADFADSIEHKCRKVADQRHLGRVFDLAGLRDPTA